MIETYGILARRHGTSMFGYSEAWCKHKDGEPMLFDSHETASEYAKRLREEINSPHIEYFPKEYK